MTSTVWTPVGTNSSIYTNEITNSVYDSATGTYDGAELSTTDTDLLYDGHIATPPLPSVYTPEVKKSTVWS